MATEEQIGNGCATGCAASIVSGVLAVGFGLLLLNVTKAIGLAVLLAFAGWCIGCLVGYWMSRPRPKPKAHRMMEPHLPQSTTEIKMNGATCTCHKCAEKYKITLGGRPLNRCRMTLCSKCGNKRCPHAFDHTLECTNSNEPNQPGAL